MQDNEKLAAGAASDLNAKLDELDEEIKMNYCYKHGQCLADDELIALGIQSDKDKIALLVDALKDARSALLYVRESHGELYGVGFDRVEKKASAALFTVAASESESNTGLHAGIKSLREKLKQEANYLQLKDWHKLSFFERQTVKKLENLGFLEKKAVADGFVGRSI